MSLYSTVPLHECLCLENLIREVLQVKRTIIGEYHCMFIGFVLSIPIIKH